MPTSSDLSPLEHQLALRLLSITTALQQLGSGTHATGSRDFGRGVAFAVSVINEAMATTTEENHR